MSDLERYREQGLAWRARQQLRDMDSVLEVERAAMERTEDFRMAAADYRIRNARTLYRSVIEGIGELEDEIGRRVNRNPDAEFLARKVQEDFVRGAAEISGRFMRGR